MESGMRAEVADSWHRSAAAGVLAEEPAAPITLDHADLQDVRAAHPLAQVFPLLDDVLGQAARDCDAVMAVSDEAGQLLWVCGSPSALRKAEGIGFVEGSNWDERLAGTNAPGLALRLDGPSMITRSEHFRQSVRSWSCAAAPIHDPATSRLLGVLDVTGGDTIVVPQTMALVKAAVRLAESELAREVRAAVAPGPVARPQLRLELLGRSEALLLLDDARGHRARLRLSPRHSELLALLASAPQGLSGDELAVLLYEHDGGSSTLRAEVNRLRNLLSEEFLGSRPYRLLAEVSGDWLAVEAKLAAGDVGGALRLFHGPMLPRSTAPGVVRLREGLSHQLRAALLHSRQPDLISAWTRSAWGSDDYELWTRQRDLLSPGAPLRALAEGQLARLERELGL
ncbi:GAF domain-containing protein [Arthrobacter woluwensis]|uniref:GAF domain-containing protein n=1 Tax=Arthrobacter woluwensis TaxID=156980 RepID=UPI001FD3E06D|nr:GAF domain-containing protein [Arthrobacter woluwensis]